MHEEMAREEDDELQSCGAATGGTVPGDVAAVREDFGEGKLRERVRWMASAMSALQDTVWQRRTAGMTTPDAGELQSTRTGMPVPCSPRCPARGGRPSPAHHVQGLLF